MALSGREVALRVQRAITEVAADTANLAVLSAQVSRGWGEIVFVRLEARVRPPVDLEAAEARLRQAVAQALAPERSSVTVAWR